MREVVEISDDEDSFAVENDLGPKEESFNFDIPVTNTHLRPGEDNVASSSGISLRSSFIGMGFSSSLVDKAIEEIGDGNAELLLEFLFKYSGLQQPKVENFDAGFFNEGNDDLAGNLRVKEEFEVCRGLTDEKMETLLKMNFSFHEVGFAMNRLGKCASIGQLMDFIFAARMAKKYEKDANNPLLENAESVKVCNNETLFCIMDKTLQLLEMGFSEIEISAAFEKCGSEALLSELAESIVAGEAYPIADQCSSTSLSNITVQRKYQSLKRDMGNSVAHQPFDSFILKTEYSSDVAPQVGTSDFPANLKGKRPREELKDEPRNWKKPKEEFVEDACNSVGRSRLESRSGHLISKRNQTAALQRQVSLLGNLEDDIKPPVFKLNPSRSMTSVATKPPYFVFGNITNLAHDSWIKISKYLYSVQPEFVNTKFYSALSRNEGYVHNLPAEDRFHVLPKGPMTIEEALPHTRKWWPSWDNRKQLSYINCDTSGISHVCERLGRMLADCKGIPSPEEQREILRQCEAKNLVWVGNIKLAPVDPEHLERILGYPLHHTRVAAMGLPERLEALKFSFQTDTLGYSLSVLRPLFPGGVTVLSFFSGIGGAEVALQRLGIRLKAVVSVEPSETKRRIVKQWWGKSQQSGELIQIESVFKLSGNTLENLLKKFGGFDIMICQSPCSGDGSLDFSTFVECVRVLQRVRSRMESNG
ncbi:probable inactive DNA (cytosine-5)-methyltransferase DRM3 [Andrographis paniculata]|uniref:probable inactive DNA (cytosine-5)-methyltransferase DRM3 n=1 Tax=Andrographis paniculata TaxID=175694 RepID=UPI0021E846BD|nr:probable inactive DNA (cytosine-5)-methyltransferase DRM3 [Andrographis paniculata]XP_051127609.1 probable inactive DNA (cytosine-5)-methyltransferase DRM3 [Andrographis paniculata]XP_051127612.1 probable inactive DNA (cytosine-5)-methyltransferase DRM3 [Andrographis paniculata]XP_051127616.1 probable inactive DNA (cytosine-5)-methyltransferase DRM3 [Andrographis paniculata]XP_051127621.1 probable inactive DNA (cytosine-5)-methyltransferase DRM3 [Andrographis paniculata]XP_051127628.1 proba